MAVPGRRSGMEDEEGDDYDMLVNEGLVGVEESDIPPRLRDLAAAAQLGDVNALRQTLDNLDGSIDEPVEDGDTVLHLTCLYGYLPCVQLLLERGACLEAKDEDGAIPLHDACAGGFIEIVQLLINGAPDSSCVKRMLDSVDAEGDTPLHHAARGEHLDVVRLLLASGGSPTKTNTYGKTPGDLAEPDTDVKRVLVDACTAIGSQGMCHAGEMEHGKEFMERMKRDDWEANVQTYDIVIRYFCESGGIERGLAAFRNISEGHCLPKLDTYSVLISAMFVRKKSKDLYC